MPSRRAVLTRPTVTTWLCARSVRLLGTAPFLLSPLLGLLLWMLLPALILRVGIPLVAEVANRPLLAPRSRPVFWFLGAVNLDMPLLAAGIALALEPGLAVGGVGGDREGLLPLVAPVPPTTLLSGPFRGPGASVLRLALLLQVQLPQALGCSKGARSNSLVCRASLMARARPSR
jgi:hypothetical protein